MYLHTDLLQNHSGLVVLGDWTYLDLWGQFERFQGACHESQVHDPLVLERIQSSHLVDTRQRSRKKPQIGWSVVKSKNEALQNSQHHAARLRKSETTRRL